MFAFDAQVRKHCGVFTEAERARCGYHDMRSLLKGAEFLTNHDNFALADAAEGFLGPETPYKAMLQLEDSVKQALADTDVFIRTRLPHARPLDLRRIHDDMVVAQVIKRHVENAGSERDLQASVGDILHDMEIEGLFERADESENPLIAGLSEMRERQLSGAPVNLRDMGMLYQGAVSQLQSDVSTAESENLDVRALMGGELMGDLNTLYQRRIEDRFGGNSHERQQALRHHNLVAPSQFKRKSREERMDLIEQAYGPDIKKARMDLDLIRATLPQPDVEMSDETNIDFE